MKSPLRIPTSIAFLFWMTVLTGVAYPLLMTGVAQLAFPAKANGSLLVVDGRVRGSRLLAQKFESATFFHARPSATDYAYLGSGASNLGATSAALAKSVGDRAAAWTAQNGQAAGAAPEDMLYASASGLDPDISLESALGQLGRVAASRHLDAAASASLEALVRGMAASSKSLIGPQRVNVVQLNARLETDPVFAASR